MEKIRTALPDVWIIKPDVFKDDRGFFFESYSFKKLKNLGIDTVFIQDNHSKSVKNTIRGLHFQSYPGQTKLVRCSKGIIWDVVVDIRPDSPTFKKWIGHMISEENFLTVLIPVGYAHGFLVISDEAEVQYKVSNYYDPKLERGIQWDDPQLNIDWKIKNPIVSKRDISNPSLYDYLKQHPNPFKP